MDDPVGCASGLVRTFVKDPAALHADGRVLRGAHPGGPGRRRLPRGAAPASRAGRPPGPGDRAGPHRPAAGSPCARPPPATPVWPWYYGDGVRGWGLRGGTFRFTGGGSRIGIRLTRVRWTSDTRVSGTVRWNQVSGRIRARLTVAGPGRASASVRLRYSDYLRHSAASLSGRYRGRRIAATMPAP